MNATVTSPNTASNSALPPEVSGAGSTGGNPAFAADVATTTATTVNRHRLNLFPKHDPSLCISASSVDSDPTSREYPHVMTTTSPHVKTPYTSPPMVTSRACGVPLARHPPPSNTRPGSQHPVNQTVGRTPATVHSLIAPESRRVKCKLRRRSGCCAFI